MKIVNKSVLFGILFQIFLFTVFGQENQYRLKGTVDNRFNGQPIMLFIFDEDSILKVDTAKVADGAFSFTGKESLKDIGILSTGNYPDTVASQIVILEKGDIEVDMDRKWVGGSPLNKLYQNYRDTVFYLHEQFKKIPFDKDEKDGFVLYGSPRHEKFVEIGKYMVNFKKQNIRNVVGQYFFEEQARKYFAESFAFPSSESCPDSAFYIVYNAADSLYKQKKWVREYIEELDASVIRNKQQKLLNEKRYIDFVLKDKLDNDKKISDYVEKSRFTMLEFWASWCGPCIAAFPSLKKVYDKYGRNDFEIVGISIDSTQSAWEKALGKIDAPWVQLWIGNAGSKLEKEIMDAYSFQGIPFSVLIDENGKIVKMGHSELIIGYLDRIF